MALGIDNYVEPGTYIGEKVQASSVTVSSERVGAVVAVAPRTRYVTDETIVRGKIYSEELTVDTSSPYNATLLNVSNRDRTQAVVYRNDNALGLGDWSLTPAILIGNEWSGASVDVSSGTGKQYFTLSLDKKKFVTIDLDANVTTIGGTPATATIANIADAINYALGDASGSAYSTYGLAYASVASVVAGTSQGILYLTSPINTSSSDVTVIISANSTSDASSTISNSAWVPTVSAAVEADTVITIGDNVYGSSDVYTIDYISVDSMTDALELATTANPLVSIVRVGTYPGSPFYTLNTDYAALSNTINWNIGSWGQAFITSLDGVFTGTGTDLKIAMNGYDPITITLTTGAPNPTAANVVTDINAAFAASSTYGLAYAHVATVSGSAVKLQAPDMLPNLPSQKGYESSIEFFAGATSGVTDIFGILSTSLPYEVKGSGQRPNFGSLFYTTYQYQRPSTDYNNPQLVYSPDDVDAYCSPLTLSNYPRNPLNIAGGICFDNSVSKLYLVQINDATVEGVPTPSQVNAAIDACGLTDAITDITVIDTEEAQTIYLMDHVATMSSLLEKKPRRGWFGMARGTSIGDPDTPDTYLYRAKQTLQPGPTSSGRGRLILNAPSSMSRTLVLDDASEVTVELDGSYLAAAAMSDFCSLPNASSPLLNTTVKGFLSDSTFETYIKGERVTLASNGVNVVTNIGGRLVLKDPITTEAGGGKVVQFEEISSSAQKDAVTKAVALVIDTNLVGLVPDDLADFLVNIKIWVSEAIKGMITNQTIAPFRDSTGTTRDIDLLTDIKAYQSEQDQRQFTFKYWFNLKYTAKRFFGEYSVDNPFFSQE
jgi:hypothetical protein